MNINTATIQELIQLKRIGPAYAQKIMDYREKFGSFQHPEDIMKVQGVGRKTWEQNKGRITVAPLKAVEVNVGRTSS